MLEVITLAMNCVGMGLWAEMKLNQGGGGKGVRPGPNVLLPLISFTAATFNGRPS